MHRIDVLFKHLQLALDAVLRTYSFAGPHVLLYRCDCHSPDNIEVSVISLSLRRATNDAKDQF